jgi:hypothetical protein
MTTKKTALDNSTPEKSAENKPDNKATIALILSIIGFIFALPSVKFLSVGAMLILIGSLIIGFMSVKPGSRTKPVIAIILSILGLLIAVMAFSNKTNDTANQSSETKTVSPSSNLENTFQDASLGYSIKYPKNWTAEKSDDFSVMFRGAKGTQDYASIQNIAYKSRGGSYNSVDEGISEIKKRIREMDKKAKITDSNKTSFVLGNMTLSGKAFEVEYNFNGKPVKQLVTFLNYQDGGIYFMFEFGSSKDQFDAASGVAVDMFNSWTVNK